MTVNNEKKKLAGFISSVNYCFGLSWSASKYYTIIRIIGEISMPLFTLITAYIGKYLIDMLASGLIIGTMLKTMLMLFLGLLLISLLQTIGQKVLQYCQTMHGDVINERIAKLIMERSYSADLEYFDNPTYHDKLVSATRDSSAMANIVWNVLTCVRAAVTFILSFVLLCRVNILYSLVMMATAIPSAIASTRYTKSLYSLSLKQVNEERKKNYYQSVAIEKEHAQDIRLYNAGHLLKEQYSTIWRNLFNERQGVNRKRTLITCILDCLPAATLILINIHIALQVVYGNATVGDYTFYNNLNTQLWSSIVLLSTSVMQIYDNQLKISNIKNLMHLENKIEDTGNRVLKKIETIEFDHVSFTYPGAHARAIDDVSVKMYSNEKVALVGLNGSGKTTIIKLMLRLYDPDLGVIRINGIDIKQYQLFELRANFSVYFQEMSNYFFTLRENLAIADHERDNAEEAAMDALNYSCCNDILEKTGKGLDTSLSRFFDVNGIELSGGQHQKLALARALYRRHTALVLDEPSSNLDPQAEHNIFQSLQSLSEGVMTIFTSHRLSNVYLADRVIVLENGKIIEDGTQKELLKNKQRYAELFHYQQERYIVKEE